MEGSTGWTIVFYVDENERSPVREFLGDLDRTTQRRFLWSIEQLRVRNTQARFPLVRHIEGDLWELREESSTNIFRVFYVFASGQRIVLLHGFQKKTQRAPRREIEIALTRLHSWRARAGGG
ncbi:MAG TPA: type II toxin-antitoxin system RelE/ParE family toxin [Thermomicrobiales bacterium]|jgi:phage-related protein